MEPTQRYCHPQADAIERGFSKLKSWEPVTDGGQHENERPALEAGASPQVAEDEKESGEPHRNRTCNPQIKSLLLYQLS